MCMQKRATSLGPAVRCEFFFLPRARSFWRTLQMARSCADGSLSGASLKVILQPLPLVPVGPSAEGRKSNSALLKKQNHMNSKSNSSAQQTKNTPIKTFKFGRLKAAVWENESDQRKFYNVTFARTFVDDEKNFRDTDSFGRDDLLVVAKLADQAHTFICERLADDRGEAAE